MKKHKRKDFHPNGGSCTGCEEGIEEYTATDSVSISSKPLTMQTYQTEDKVTINWKAVAVEKLRNEGYPNGSIIRIIGDFENIIEHVLQAREEWLREALEWILPMAKAYAHEHDVGKNKEIVDHAADRLSLINQKK